VYYFTYQVWEAYHAPLNDPKKLRRRVSKMQVHKGGDISTSGLVQFRCSKNTGRGMVNAARTETNINMSDIYCNILLYSIGLRYYHTTVMRVVYSTIYTVESNNLYTQMSHHTISKN
jgi:hypothetical protein